MNYTVQAWIGISSIIISLILGVYRFKVLDRASKLICLLIGISFLNELIGYYTTVQYRTNIPIYNLFSFLELSLVALYFNRTIDTFRKKNIGIIVAICGILLGIGNMLFFQPITVFNSYFILFEGVCILGMSLFFYARLLLQDEEMRILKYRHFWFTTLLVFSWCITYLNWGMYDILYALLQERIWMVHLVILVAGGTYYIGIALIFVFYKRTQPIVEY